MAEKLRAASPSPHITDGVIYWYEGDSFTLNLKLTLESMGEKYSPSEGDRLTVTFFDTSGFAVHTFSSLPLEEGTAALVFESGVSAHMPRGRYYYNVCLERAGGGRVTVASGNPAVVL